METWRLNGCAEFAASIGSGIEKRMSADAALKLFAKNYRDQQYCNLPELLPTNCRFATAEGDRQTYVIEQPPQVRWVTCGMTVGKAKKRPYRIGLPFVIFVVSVDKYGSGYFKHSFHAFFSDAAIRSANAPLRATLLPNIDGSGRVCCNVDGYITSSPSDLTDGLVTAFWDQPFSGDWWDDRAYRLFDVWGLGEFDSDRYGEDAGDDGSKTYRTRIARTVLKEWERRTAADPLFALTDPAWFGKDASSPVPMSRVLGQSDLSSLSPTGLLSRIVKSHGTETKGK